MTAPARLARDPPPREEGSISVVSIGVMAVVVVLAMASADVARVLGAASQAQTAADAAALAAAQEQAVPSGDVSPEEAARNYAARNGAELLSCECGVGSKEAVAEVRIPVGRLLLFGNDRTVRARARAVVDPPG